MGFLWRLMWHTQPSFTQQHLIEDVLFFSFNLCDRLAEQTSYYSWAPANLSEIKLLSFSESCLYPYLATY